MNPVAHLLFGALLSVLLIVFGIEYPRRRRGMPKSNLDLWTIIAVTLALALLAVAPQATKYFGDRKLDVGPILNFFVFHDVLELLGERFRLGDGMLDPPVTVFGLGFGVAFLFLVYLRSEDADGWRNVWRDVAYLSVIILCLVAVRALVSGKSYIYKPSTQVYVHGEAYLVVEDTVFSPRTLTPVVGTIRDKAIAVRDASLVVNSVSWEDAPLEVRQRVSDFINIYQNIYQALEYDSLVQLLGVIQQTPGAVPEDVIRRLVAAGTLPRRDIPLGVALGLPMIAFAVCGYLLYPYIELE